jgi:hypothetical protein
MMAFSPFQQPKARLPRSLDRLAHRIPAPLPGMTIGFTTTNTSVDGLSNASQHDDSNEMLDKISVERLDKVVNEKICVQEKASKQNLWIAQVQNLKKGATIKKTSEITNCNVSKQRKQMIVSDDLISLDEKSTESFDPFYKFSRHRVVAQDIVPCEKGETQRRRVRFQLDEQHAAPKKGTGEKKKNILIDKRIHYSRNEIKATHAEAQKTVKAFRASQPDAVARIDRFYMEFCNIDNKKKDDFDIVEDEEKEEIMRNFLEEWAKCDVRGLEDDVTLRRTFRQDRKMAIESILAYQEKLVERYKRMNLRLTSGSAATDLMAESLRARSESTSHRARMFAMYMALGDALAATTADDENESEARLCI